MKIINEKNNRLAIYVFYDNNGIVDDYIPYFLTDLQKNIKDLIVICNGQISPEGYQCFQQFTDTILVRENIGLDAWAYKMGLDHVGWDGLKQYDEVLMINDTILGPVYPFAEMFTTMDQRDLDFWGMTKHYRLSTNAFDNEYGYTPEHLQTFFLACRRTMIQSEVFQEYWDNLPAIDSYKDAVGKHETYFTKYFYDKGFQYDAYVQTDDLKEYNPNPIFAEAYRIMVDRKCPVFKKKLFFMDYEHIIGSTNGDMVLSLYDYIDKSTNYDVNMILQTILRSKNEADVAKSLHMNYILPSTISKKSEICKELQVHKTAAVFYVHEEKVMDRLYHYASNLPKEIDIYLLYGKSELQEKLQAEFQKDACHTITYVPVEQKGGEVFGFLMGMRDYVKQYEFICCAQNVEVLTHKYLSILDGHERRNLDNILGSEDYICNIIEKFIENPRLGIASPALPNHGYYLHNMGNEWGSLKEYDQTISLAKELGINVPLQMDGDMMSPYGHCFWCRVEALSVLLDFDWSKLELPMEEKKERSILLRAIENLYAPTAQQKGYYAVRIFTTESARVEYTNLYYYLRKERSILDDSDTLNSSMFYAKEEEFEQEKVLNVVTKRKKGPLELKYDFSTIDEEIRQLRFDPCEESGAILQGVSITVIYEDETSYNVEKQRIHHNGYEMEDGYMFLHGDPQLFFELPSTGKKIKKVKVKCNHAETIQDLTIETIELYMGKVTEAWDIIHEVGKDRENLQVEIQRLQAEMQCQQAEMQRMQAEMNEKQQQIEDYKGRIENMEQSISWKLTKPIRMINRLLKVK